MRKTSLLSILFAILLPVLLAAGCGHDASIPEQSFMPAETEAAPSSVPQSTPSPIAFRSGTVCTGDESDLALVIDADEFPLLDRFSALTSIDFSGSTCYEQILAFSRTHPEVSVCYTVPFGDRLIHSDDEDVSVTVLPEPGLLRFLPHLRSLTVTEPITAADALELNAVRNDLQVQYMIGVAGLTVDPGAETLDLRSVSPEYSEEVLQALPALPNLKLILLSPEEEESEWTLNQADALQRSKDGLLVDYRVSAFGTTFSLADEIVSFNGIQLKKQQDDLKALLPYLCNVKRLDMESCGISNADMAKLRDEFPQPKIVWRVNVGTYSCRTDAIMIRFSSKLESKCLYDADTDVLRYCNEIRYLDLGHNHIKSMDFLSYMPDLEVVIIAVGFMEDISGIANHEKLEYCEFESGRIRDLTPLASCPNLEHLNVSYNLISDITPLYGLTKLKRLWISRNSIPKSQVEEIRRLFPETEINTTTQNPTGEGWRWLSEINLLKCDRYELLCKQFCYDLRILTYTEETRPVYDD